MLDVIEVLGGVKKFKELAEAILDTNSDDIPFRVVRAVLVWLF